MEALRQLVKPNSVCLFRPRNSYLLPEGSSERGIFDIRSGDQASG
jgi:hypothetical protein